MKLMILPEEELFVNKMKATALPEEVLGKIATLSLDIDEKVQNSGYSIFHNISVATLLSWFSQLSSK